MFEEEEFLRTTSWNFLLKHSIKKLPINPLAIAKTNQWQVSSYKALAEESGLSVEDIAKRFGENIFCCYSKKRGAFLIGYHAYESKNALRWDFMKQEAHILLGHINKERPYLVPNKDMDWSHWEEQAEGLTRRILCPSILLHCLQAATKEDIVKYCGVPLEKAEKIAAHMLALEARNKFLTRKEEEFVFEQFQEFVQETLDKRDLS